jgi:hypothetical protein
MSPLSSVTVIGHSVVGRHFQVALRGKLKYTVRPQAPGNLFSPESLLHFKSHHWFLEEEQTMSIARRNFLKSAAKTTLSAGLAIVSAQGLLGQEPTRSGMRRGSDKADFPIPLEAQEDELFRFRSSTFTPYVGDIFQIPNARGEMITLRLVSVSDYKVKSATRIATKRTLPTESFSLTFSATEKLPQFTSIHKVSHPALGDFDLFLTSRETDDGKVTYEAVFNHLR